MTKRVPNNQLDGYFANRVEVKNYNDTVRAYWVKDDAGRDVYIVRHWATVVSRYTPDTGELECIPYYISQTTSTLTGRILRAMPRESVARFIETVTDKRDARRLRGMLTR